MQERLRRATGWRRFNEPTAISFPSRSTYAPIATIPLTRIDRYVAGQGNINTPKKGLSLSGQIEARHTEHQIQLSKRQKIRLSIPALHGLHNPH